jgi:hypothetical protein
VPIARFEKLEPGCCGRVLVPTGRGTRIWSCRPTGCGRSGNSRREGRLAAQDEGPPGDSWEVSDGGKRTVHGPEEVEVPAGKFKALRVVREHEGGTLTSRYAPGVGEVKRVEKRGNEKEKRHRSR